MEFLANIGVGAIVGQVSAGRSGRTNGATIRPSIGYSVRAGIKRHHSGRFWCRQERLLRCDGTLRPRIARRPSPPRGAFRSSPRSWMLLASRFLLHVLGAAAEFERSLIRERTQAGRLRYKQDFDAGKVGKTVYSRSGKNLRIGRPKRIFNRERVIDLRRNGPRRPKACGWHGAARGLGLRDYIA